MDPEFALAVVLLLAGYLAVGAAFGVVFIWRGVAAVDPAAEGGGIWFRMMILPGVCALWPVMAGAWASAAGHRTRTAAVVSPWGRSHRFRHLVLWLFLGPLAVSGLVLAIALRDGGAGVLP